MTEYRGAIAEENYFVFGYPKVAEPAININQCIVCGKEPSILCSGCSRLGFCGRTCQEKNWPEHRTACGPQPVTGQDRLKKSNANIPQNEEVFKVDTRANEFKDNDDNYQMPKESITENVLGNGEVDPCVNEIVLAKDFEGNCQMGTEKKQYPSENADNKQKTNTIPYKIRNLPRKEIQRNIDINLNAKTSANNMNDQGACDNNSNLLQTNIDTNSTTKTSENNINDQGACDNNSNLLPFYWTRITDVHVNSCSQFLISTELVKNAKVQLSNVEVIAKDNKTTKDVINVIVLGEETTKKLLVRRVALEDDLQLVEIKDAMGNDIVSTLESFSIVKKVNRTACVEREFVLFSASGTLHTYDSSSENWTRIGHGLFQIIRKLNEQIGLWQTNGNKQVLFSDATHKIMWTRQKNEKFYWKQDELNNPLNHQNYAIRFQSDKNTSTLMEIMAALL